MSPTPRTRHAHRTLRQRLRSPAGLAVALVVVAASSELKFRRRSAELALEGSVDAQIILELAVWGLVIGLALVANVHRGRLGVARGQTIGPAARLLVVICALGVASAAFTGGPLAWVRAMQFAAATAVGIVAYHRAATDDDLVALWVALRRATIALAVAASLGTLVWPGRGDLGTGRFHWFEVHPIATAGALGVAIVMATTVVFGLPDPAIRSARRWTAYGAVVLLLATLLVLTGSRGAMAGTVAGVAAVGVLSRHPRRRGVALLVSTVTAGLMMLGFGTAAIINLAVRGQTAAQLLTLTGRTELFGIAYDLFLQRPLLGYGFLSGREVFLERVPWAGEAHNMFVEIAISLGAVGLIIYIALFAWLARVSIGAVVQRPTVVGTAVRDTTGLLVFVIVAGGVTSGAAGLPGLQWVAVVVTAVLADRWWARRQRVALARERQATRWVRRQPDSMTSV